MRKPELLKCGNRDCIWLCQSPAYLEVRWRLLGNFSTQKSFIRSIHPKYVFEYPNDSGIYWLTLGQFEAYVFIGSPTYPNSNPKVWKNVVNSLYFKHFTKFLTKIQHTLFPNCWCVFYFLKILRKIYQQLWNL